WSRDGLINPAVIFLFEYLITIDCEVRLAWSRKLSWARLIFLLNRYIALFLYFLSLIPLLPTGNLFVSSTLSLLYPSLT
ncbi:uncharacterized protein TRAVEDRAFT_136581, partial [Trametes versicolor FP-101664 SS1]